MRRAVEAWNEAGREPAYRESLPPPVLREENAAVILEEVIGFNQELSERSREIRGLADRILSGLEKASISSGLIEELEAALDEPDIARRLRAAREAAGYDRFDADVDYDLGFDLLVPHVSGMSNLARLLHAEAVVQAAREDWAEAHETLKVSLRFGELLREEPLVISQLVRKAIGDAAFEKLVPDFLQEVAEDPFDRETLRYRREEARIILYPDVANVFRQISFIIRFF